MNDINVYVSFETAKLLKEQGFDSLVHAHYAPDGKLLVSEYKAIWVTPAPTHGQALEWLRQHNVFTSFYVEENPDTHKNTWAFQYYDKNLDVIATDSGLSITDYTKCVDLAIAFAAKFLLYNE